MWGIRGCREIVAHGDDDQAGGVDRQGSVVAHEATAPHKPKDHAFDDQAAPVHVELREPTSFGGDPDVARSTGPTLNPAPTQIRPRSPVAGAGLHRGTADSARCSDQDRC